MTPLDQALARLRVFADEWPNDALAQAASVVLDALAQTDRDIETAGQNYEAALATLRQEADTLREAIEEYRRTYLASDGPMRRKRKVEELVAALAGGTAARETDELAWMAEPWAQGDEAAREFDDGLTTITTVREAARECVCGEINTRHCPVHAQESSG